MEISVIITDTLQTLGISKSLLHRQNFTFNSHVSLSDSDQSPILQISSAVIFPIDAVAPPPVKPNYRITVPRMLRQKKRRTKRKSLTDEPGDGGYFGDSGGDGIFGNGGSGKGWNFDGFGGGGFSWEDSSSSSFSDPAFDFVYEVVSWIVLSNCVHFAFKKIVRGSADGIEDRGKVAPVC
ncbi:hypothetical protein RJ641_021052 [Dillenia turbinata]|uniref:Uncharacterized protein n=1 Tax=Dillenia turbinata TaxID=194707 RepID=A0AAN8UKZ0_9MAGN